MRRLPLAQIRKHLARKRFASCYKFCLQIGLLAIFDPIYNYRERGLMRLFRSIVMGMKFAAMMTLAWRAPLGEQNAKHENY